MLTPLYLAEIAPVRERGALVSFGGRASAEAFTGDLRVWMTSDLLMKAFQLGLRFGEALPENGRPRSDLSRGESRSNGPGTVPVERLDLEDKGPFRPPLVARRVQKFGKLRLTMFVVQANLRGLHKGRTSLMVIGRLGEFSSTAQPNDRLTVVSGGARSRRPSRTGACEPSRNAQFA